MSACDRPCEPPKARRRLLNMVWSCPFCHRMWVLRRHDNYAAGWLEVGRARPVSLIGYKAKNHPQQVGKTGAKDKVDDRATHPDDFAKFDERFNFTIDVAAAAHNTKCERFYDIEQDGLAQSWAGERVWCNPPWSNIRPWVERASWPHLHHAELVVMLLPSNRTEQGWWQEFVEPFRDGRCPSWCSRRVVRTEFLPGRMRFIKAGQTEIGPNERPPSGCVLLIWQRQQPQEIEETT